MTVTTHTFYDGVAGSPVTTLVEPYKAGTDQTISVANASVLAAAPNYATITNGDGGFVTIHYTTITSNTISGITPKAGQVVGIFAAGCLIGRRYTNEDDKTIKAALRELEPEVNELDARMATIENNNQVIISATATLGGKIYPEGSIACLKGTSQTFTLGAGIGYPSYNVKVDGVNKGQISTFTFSDIQTGHTIQVIPVVPVVYSMKITPANETPSTSGVSDITASDGSDVSTLEKRLAIYDALVPPFLIPRNDFSHKAQLKPNDLTKDINNIDVTSLLPINDLFRGAQPIWWRVTGNQAQFVVEWTTGQRDDWMTAHKVGDKHTSRLYLGVFNATTITEGGTTYLQSCYNTTAPTNTKSNDTFTQYAWNCGATYNSTIYLTYLLWQILLTWCYGVLNFQDKVAKGYSSGGSSAADLHDAQTNFSLTGGDTQGDTSDTSIDAVVGGIKNFYAHMWHMLGGATANAGVVTIQTDQADKAKVTVGSATWERLSGTMPTSEGYVKTTMAQDKGTFLPVAIGGSSSTYFCDYYYYAAGQNQLLAGGRCSHGALCGPFYVDANAAVGYGGTWSYGARLQAYEPVD